MVKVPDYYSTSCCQIAAVLFHDFIMTPCHIRFSAGRHLFFDIIFGDFPVRQNCATFDMLFSTCNSTRNGHKTFFAIFWG